MKSRGLDQHCETKEKCKKHREKLKQGICVPPPYKLIQSLISSSRNAAASRPSRRYANHPRTSPGTKPASPDLEQPRSPTRTADQLLKTKQSCNLQKKVTATAADTGPGGAQSRSADWREIFLAWWASSVSNPVHDTGGGNPVNNESLNEIAPEVTAPACAALCGDHLVDNRVVDDQMARM
jgi:hypothetical protein